MSVPHPPQSAWLNDSTAHASVADKYSERVATWVDHNGARVLHCMESMGGPFHIDQLCMLWPDITRRDVLATIHYVNESGMALHIGLAQYGRVRRWTVTHCSGLHKSQLRAKWLLHRSRSRRPSYPHYAEPTEFDITEL